jgi:hypothetical protein
MLQRLFMLPLKNTILSASLFYRKAGEMPDLECCGYLIYNDEKTGDSTNDDLLAVSSWNLQRPAARKVPFDI